MGKDFATAFAERGQTYKDDISPTSKGKWKEEYEFVYEGERMPCHSHFTLGSGSADTCLSIHWHWDADRRQAIVAHVGRHKTNTKT